MTDDQNQKYIGKAYAGVTGGGYITAGIISSNSSRIDDLLENIFKEDLLGFRKAYDEIHGDNRVVILEDGKPELSQYSKAILLAAGDLIWGFEPKPYLPSEAYSIESVVDSILKLEENPNHKPEMLWPLIGRKVATINESFYYQQVRKGMF